jgi:hypothetical protein
MSIRRLLLSATALLLGGSAVAGMPVSAATYTQASSYAATVTAAPDWTPPTVTMTSPGALVTGTATLTATASDARGRVASVSIQRAPAAGGSWTSVCTATTAPYTCAWSTGAVADGAYELRAVATDDAGYSATSDSVTTRVANNAQVVLADPGEVVRGTTVLQASVSALPGGAKFTFSYALSGTTSWKTICSQTATNTLSATCSWNTGTVSSDLHDLRVVATAAGNTSFTDIRSQVMVDNVSPTVTMTSPGAVVRGTVQLVANAGDEESGIDTVTVQHRRVGAATWTTCGVLTDAPYACSLVSTTLADGSYELRAIATDAAGNSTTSTSVTVAVDNTVSSVSITGPTQGSIVRGAVSVTAAASSNRGITSVTVEYRPSGAGSWTPVCTDTTSPFSCTWDTAPLSGSHELRAVLVDGSGATTVSAVVGVTVDNAALRGLDVQAANASVSGRPSAGDQLVLTYSTVVDPTTIKTGWDGTGTTALTVELADKNVAGAAIAGYDRASFLGTNLGQVAFSQNYVNTKGKASLVATLTQSTRSVGGTNVTIVTVTLGEVASGANALRTAGQPGTMWWSPTAAVRTPTGVTASTAVVTESGAADRDL